MEGLRDHPTMVQVIADAPRPKTFEGALAKKRGREGRKGWGNEPAFLKEWTRKGSPRLSQYLLLKGILVSVEWKIILMMMRPKDEVDVGGDQRSDLSPLPQPDFIIIIIIGFFSTVRRNWYKRERFSHSTRLGCNSEVIVVSTTRCSWRTSFLRRIQSNSSNPLFSF